MGLPSGPHVLLLDNLLVAEIDGTLGISNVVGHREAATAIRTTFPGGPKSQKAIDGRQKTFCGENKVD